MLNVLSWWLITQVLGLIALPLAWRLFARLPGRGYPFAKILGLLLVSYVLWLGASFGLLANDLGGAVAALLIVAGTSAWLGRDAWRRGPDGVRPLVAWLCDQRWLVLVTELLFLAVFAGWAVFRAYNPEISGTEKPMEFAFINGVLRSRLFPPQDPWLSGYGISYYYFGYVMLALLVRLTGVLPEVGFNLGVALWFALTMIGAFGVGYDLVRSAGGNRKPGEASPDASTTQGRGIRYGLLAALFVGVIGNLQGIIDGAYQRGLLSERFVRWLDIKGMLDAAPTGDWVGGYWWWWRASRVIHDKDLLGNSVEVIDEFPFFSFLLGDMHPHVLALPFGLLAVALALNLLLGARNWKLEAGSLQLPAQRQGSGGGPSPRHPTSTPAAQAVQHPIAKHPRGTSRFQLLAFSIWRFLGGLTGLGAPGILVYAVALGALGFLNTWDFPVYLGLAVLAVGIGLAWGDGLSWVVAGRTLVAGIILAVLSWLLYLPFYIGLQSQLEGVLPNLLFPSRFSQFFVMFGPFLVAAAFLLALLTWGRGWTVVRGALATMPLILLLPVVFLALMVLSLSITPGGRQFVQETLNNPAVAANVTERSLAGLVGLVLRLRLAAAWTWLALAGLIAWAAGVLWAGVQKDDGRPQESGLRAHLFTRLSVIDLFVVLFIGLALILALVPEFAYLRDLFRTRMNTVFKLYYQAWALLALASAYGISRLAQRGAPLALKAPALALVTVLLLAGLWYPLKAAPSKADNFDVDPTTGDPRPTLDGLAYLRRDDPAQMAAIEWLRANVAPDAVVVEASGGSYSPAGRVSMATGNPTLLGWDFHERQWRGDEGYGQLAAGRPEALDQIYRTARPEDLPALLDQWGVDYVFVGNQERSKYQISDAALARFDRVLTLVYDKDGVRIYAR